MQYLPIFLLVFLFNIPKSRVFANELNILHLHRYYISFFLLKVWYTLESSEENYNSTQTDKR